MLCRESFPLITSEEVERRIVFIQIDELAMKEMYAHRVMVGNGELVVKGL